MKTIKNKRFLVSKRQKSFRKLIILLILTILLTNPISAKTIEKELYERENVEVPGYNITLMGIGNKEKSIITCINNEIHILDKRTKREIGNLKIEPTRIYEDYVKLQITYSKDDICDESCSNDICFNTQTQPEENESVQENQETTQDQQTNQQDIIQNKEGINIFSITLFLLVLVLLIILLFKKKR